MDARVFAQRPSEFPIADVDRDDVDCARLQQTIGEPACRRAGIKTPTATDVELQEAEGVLQLDSAARDVARPFGHLDLGIDQDHLPGLRSAGAGSSQADVPSHHCGGSARARREEAALRKQRIKSHSFAHRYQRYCQCTPRRATVCLSSHSLCAPPHTQLRL